MEVKSFSLAILGDTGCGKTCFGNRFTQNLFNPNEKPTIGAEYFQKIYYYNISNNENKFSSTHRMSNSLGYIQRLNNSRQKNIEEKNQNNITKQKFNSVDYNYENKSKEKKILFLNSDDYNKLYTNLKYYWIKTPTLKYNNRNNSTKTLYSLKKNNQGFKTSRDNYNPRNEDSNNISILKFRKK